MKITKLLKKELLRYKASFLLLIMLQLARFAAELVLPYITGRFADILLEQERKRMPAAIAVFAVAAVVGILSTYFADIVRIGYKERVAANLNESVIEHLQRIPLLKLLKMDMAFLSNKISSDAEQSISVVTDYMMAIVLGIITILSAMGIVICTNVFAIIPILIMLPVYIGLYFWCKNRISGRMKKFRNARSELFSRQTEQLTRAKIIRANSAQPFFHRRTMDAIEQVYTTGQDYARAGCGFAQTIVLFNRIATIVLFVLAGIMVAGGNMTIGDFILINAYYEIILSEARDLGEAFSLYRGVYASLERMEELLVIEEEPEGQEEPEKLSEVQISHLNFGYDEEHKIFDDYQLQLEKGRIYLLKGVNGRGKSTLINLMTGLYTEYEGTICYDGSELMNLNRDKLRMHLVGIMEQEPLPVHGTLRDNITLGLEEKIPDKTILDYMQKFGMSEFLVKQKDGLDTVLEGETGGLSGGEKQKIAIIRMLLKDASFMIFDEPTSALDSASVQVFLSIIQELKKDKIILIITHDQMLENACDRVVML